MADFRYLKQRRQGWYFQLAVPRKFREALGKATITTSLQTRDVTVAQRRRRPRLVQAQEAFAKLSGARGPRATKTLAPDVSRGHRRRRHGQRYRETCCNVMAAEARAGIRAWDKPELDRGYQEALEGYVATGRLQARRRAPCRLLHTARNRTRYRTLPRCGGCSPFRAHGRPQGPKACARGEAKR